MQVIKDSDATWTVSYIPNEVGETYFDIFVADELVPGCPFKVNIFDVEKIRVSNIYDGFLGQLSQFQIDISQAGIGQLEILIEDGRIPCDAVARGSFIFDVSFLPCYSGPHAIDIRFNGFSVPGQSFCRLKSQENLIIVFDYHWFLSLSLVFLLGSPFFCYIADLSQVTISENLSNTPVGIPLSFDVYHENLPHLSDDPMPLDITIASESCDFKTIINLGLSSFRSIWSLHIFYPIKIERKYYTNQLCSQ